MLWHYDVDKVAYLLLSPREGAVVSLFNGKYSLRHLALILEYILDFNDLNAARDYLISVINKINEDFDAIVNMADILAPYVKIYDTLQFIASSSEGVKQHRLVYPLSITAMFSNACETNCVYCYANRRIIPPSQQLSTKRWIEIFHEARSLGIEQVGLTGGDPLFRKDSITLLGELIKLEMLFLVSTKCHITREKADHLVDIGMTQPINQITREIQLSIDGPDEDTADVLAGSPGYFNRAIDSIKNLTERGFYFRVKAVLVPFNAPRVYDWIKVMVGLGATRLSVAAYNRTFYRHHDDLFLSLDDRKLIEEQCERAKSDFPEMKLQMSGLDPVTMIGKGPASANKYLGGSSIEAGSPSFGDKMEEWKKRTHCSGGRSNLTITPDGKVVLCETVPQEGIFVVGDLTTQSIMDVWNSQKLLDFAYPSREKFVGSACYDCDYLSECLSSLAGYCFRDSYFNYGNVFERPPQCPFSPDNGMRIG